LETCEAGTNFADPLVLYSGSKADVIKFKVSELNELLLKKFDGDVQTQADFRLTALLTVDAGTGAPGTGSNPFLYPSESKTATVSPYGLPRLDLIVEGSPVGKIESAAGNGVYTGLVKLDKTKPFTFLDPEANISYGKNAAGNALEINGSGITSDESGWYQVSADVNAMTYALSAYMIGVVGSATPNGWNAPDIKMDYIAKRGVWVVTTDLIVGEIKFRKNDGWAWNLGGSLNNLTQGGNNIPITQAGNYTITLTIINDLTGSCTIVKN
jgi:PKD repeat protein